MPVARHVGERGVGEQEGDGCDRRRGADADLPEAPHHARRQEREVQAQGDIESSPVRKGREPVGEVVRGVECARLGVADQRRAAPPAGRPQRKPSRAQLPEGVGEQRMEEHLRVPAEREG